MKPETIKKRIEELIRIQKEVAQLHQMAELAASGQHCKMKLFVYNGDKAPTEQKNSSDRFMITWQFLNGAGEEWKQEKPKGEFEHLEIDLHDDFTISLIGELIRQRMKRIEYLSKRYIK